MSVEPTYPTLSASERTRLVEEHLPMARRLARRFARAGENHEDLAQVAALGLILAAERYDAERGHGFLSFAIPTVLGELRRHLRDTRWALRVPRRVQENLAAVRQSRELLTQELGRAPKPREVADAVGISVEDVLEALEAGNFLGHIGGVEPDEAPAPQTEGVALDRLRLREAMALLDRRERRIVAMRYGRDMTQSEIGAEIGISQAHVHRLLRGIERRLADALGDEDPE